MSHGKIDKKSVAFGWALSLVMLASAAAAVLMLFSISLKAFDWGQSLTSRPPGHWSQQVQ